LSEDDRLLAIANASGFPLQIAIEQAVRASYAEHHWKVQYVEHSWNNRLDAQQGFIDLVLRDQNGTFTLVVECKRVRDAAWLFLRPDGTNNKRRHCKTWVSSYDNGVMKYFGWHDLIVDPPGVEAPYCTVRGQSDAMPMLERIAADVVSSTEALAWEEKDYRPERGASVQFYISVIVTTAELKIATFAPGDISMNDGAIKTANFETVPVVRFRKQLSPRSDAFSSADYESGVDTSSRKEHTVFVVNAEAIVDFLAVLELEIKSANAFA